MSGNWGKLVIPATSVLRGSSAGWNRFIAGRMAGLPGVPECCPGAVEAEEVG